jgi:hypothetical protein
MALTALTTTLPPGVADGDAVGVVLGDGVGDVVAVGDADGEGDGDTIVTGGAHESTTATRSATARRLISARLLEHLAARVEPAVGVLLEDQLAALAVELVVATLIAETDAGRVERDLADDAHRSHQIGSSSTSG